MEPNIMALLKTLLSGTAPTLSGQAPMNARPAAPQMMQRQPTMTPQTQQPMVQPGNQPYRPTPMMAGEQPDHGGPGGFTDPNNSGGGNGGGDGHGGKSGNNRRLSEFEKKMRAIANKGPRAYTNTIEKNLGFKHPTIGYGGGDPSNFKTGMASALTGITSPPYNPPPIVETGDFPTWPKV